MPCRSTRSPLSVFWHGENIMSQSEIPLLAPGPLPCALPIPISGTANRSSVKNILPYFSKKLISPHLYPLRVSLFLMPAPLATAVRQPEPVPDEGKGASPSAPESFPPTRLSRAGLSPKTNFSRLTIPSPEGFPPDMRMGSEQKISFNSYGQKSIRNIDS